MSKPRSHMRPSLTAKLASTRIPPLPAHAHRPMPHTTTSLTKEQSHHADHRTHARSHHRHIRIRNGAARPERAFHSPTVRAVFGSKPKSLAPALYAHGATVGPLCHTGFYGGPPETRSS